MLSGPSRALLILQAAYKQMLLRFFCLFVVFFFLNYSFRNYCYFFCCHYHLCLREINGEEIQSLYSIALFWLSAVPAN